MLPLFPLSYGKQTSQTINLWSDCCGLLYNWSNMMAQTYPLPVGILPTYFQSFICLHGFLKKNILARQILERDDCESVLSASLFNCTWNVFPFSPWVIGLCPFWTAIVKLSLSFLEHCHMRWFWFPKVESYWWTQLYVYTIFDE